MTLDELKASWISNADPEIQTRMWNRAAEDYRKKPLPDLDRDPFLKLLRESIHLTPEMQILDVGCGAGGYSLALAPMVQKTLGLDISDRMIQVAKEQANAQNISNAQFDCIGWNAVDIHAMGLQNQFDVAFAHMTPAICDFATLEKLDQCSRNLCMVEKPTRRQDAVLDHALRLVQLDSKNSYDRDLLYIFNYLWCKGYEPQLFYRKEVWKTSRSTQDMAGWCIDRAMLRRKLSDAEKTVIQRYIEELEQDGVVHECTTTTRVTIIWTKEK